MATSRELRPTKRPAEAGSVRVAIVGPVAAILCLLVGAFVTLGQLCGVDSERRSAQPGFLVEALGAPQASA